MEQPTISQELLEQFICPTFLVKNGIVVTANHAALVRQIQVGTNVSDLIDLGKQEYADLTDGKLYLTLSIGEMSCSACVTRTSDWDIFCLESIHEEPELRALALAAQQLRGSLARALTAIDHLKPNTASDDSPELQQINRSLYQLHRTINNMSDAGQYSRKLGVKTQLRDASSVIEEIMLKAAHHTESTGHTLTYKGLNQSVYAPIDTEILERGLLNLISNAIKFSSDTSVIAAALNYRNNRLYLSVSNSTGGIPADIRANIFSRFLREPGIEDGRNGLGLGMTIIRSAAFAHGGTVLFEQPDETTVRFTLTLSAVPSKDQVVRSPILLPTDYAGGYDHTLIELSDVLPAIHYE